jgi:small subunit ribosomal protein S16
VVRIRLKRLGRHHRPFYRISVMDIRKARDGESIEDIGFYDPMVLDNSKSVSVKMDRYDYWVGVGAQPSDNVKVLVKKLKANKWTESAAPPAAIAPKEPAPATAEAPAEGGEAAAE